MLRRTWLLALLWTCVGLDEASAQSYRTYTYSEVHGLPSSQVFDVEQGSDGLLWVATRAGIGTFDGFVWKTSFHSDDLPLASAVQMEVGPEGEVWIAGRDLREGIAHRDGRGWTHVRPPADLPSAPATRVVRLLCAPARNEVAVATAECGVFLWNGDDWAHVGLAEGLASETTHALAVADDRLYVGSEAGAFVIRGESAEPVEGEIPAGAVIGIAVEEQTNDERIWLLGRDWLGVREDNSLRQVDGGLASAPIPAAAGGFLLEPDRHAGLYFGNTDRLFHYDASSDSTRRLGMPEGLVAEGVTGMLRDRDGNLWVGTPRGLTRLPLPRFANYDGEQGLLEDEVSAIIQLRDGRMLFGHGWGLSFVEEAGIRTERFLAPNAPAQMQRRVLDMTPDGDGGVWLAASYLGVGHFAADDTQRWYHAASHDRPLISAVFVDPAGRVLAGAASGLYELTGDQFTPLAGAPEVRVRRLAGGPDGELMIGSSGTGVYVETEEGWSRSSHPDLEDANDVYCLLVDPRGRVLVGTLAGLFVQEGATLTRCLDPRVDLPTYSLLMDGDGYLWAGTDRGFLRWDGERERRYTVFEGLAGQEANRDAAYLDSSLNVWLGTDKGVSRYQARFDEHATAPEVKITGVHASGERMPDGAAASLAYTHNDLLFEFRSVSFVSDGRVRYRHRLDGFDDEWSESLLGAGQLRYASLPPGQYRLHVQARNAISDWGPVAVSIPVSIRRPFWQDPWFVALCIGLTVTAGSIVTALILARRQSNRLEVLVRERSAELEESERRYREIFEKNRAIQLILDPQSGEILDANQAACDFWGGSPERLRRSSFADLTDIPPPDVRRQLERLEEDPGIELVLSGPDRESASRNIEVYACGYELRGRRVIQATVHDVTRRVRLEEELQQSDKLKAIGELAGGIAHDFNNLLTAIIGFSDVALTKIDADSPLVDDLKRVKQAGERGAGLVRQLLAFSRKQFLRPEVFDLNPVVEEMSEMLHRLLGENIHIVTKLNDSAGRIEIDRGQIDRVLINLAINARDAMPGGGQLMIETEAAQLARHESTPALPCALLTVSDSGVGMSPNTRSRIFEPFFSTKGTGKGTGLGLSTVYGIVRQSGGEIYVSSVPDLGTIFRIYLPQVRRDVPSTEPRAEDRGEASTATVGAGGRTVLLVEDDEDVRRLSATLLRAQGFEVFEAPDGKEALDLFHVHSDDVDLLLTDIVMPRMGGRELVAMLTASRPGLPVIYMSGYRGEPAESALDAQSHFIKKPFTSDELRRKVLSALAARVPRP